MDKSLKIPVIQQQAYLGGIYVSTLMQMEFLVIHYRKGKKCPVWLNRPPNNEHNDTHKSLHSAQTTKCETGRKKTTEGQKSGN